MRWAELVEGTAGPERVGPPITLTDIVRYQGASGDFNPIHHDPEVARRAGFPAPFAVGMLQAGVLATYATDWLGAEHVRRFKVQFREVAWPGDTITYRGTISGRRVEGEQRLVDLDLTATRQTGGTHLLGWATFVVPD